MDRLKAYVNQIGKPKLERALSTILLLKEKELKEYTIL